MFGRNKPIVFDPYARQRSRSWMPRWLVLLLVGTVAGAGGVIYLQEKHLPPRLSPSESAALRGAFDKAEAERQRLQGELAQAQKQLSAALADNKSLGTELATLKSTAQSLHADVASLVDALPPDPRDNGIEVRAGRFEAGANALSYDVVLTRPRGASRPTQGVLQLTLAGESAKGGAGNVTAKALPVSIGHHEIVRGTVPLPEGFRPKQATVQVLDREGGRSLGMRVMLVK
ncbi:DUF6776 family protein [Ideonella sp. DXS29W]|uniref:DUF6776 family protein n=1 Tax=Ideonella lacteola TaxID=2984193 RepID=A0ABU9BLY9_9BURK